MLLLLPFKSRIAERDGQLNKDWDRQFRSLEASYGRWRAVEYLATNFSADAGMTWLVELADQVTFSYGLMGKRLEVSFVIRGAVVGGVVSATLRIDVPGTDANGSPFIAAHDVSEPCFINDNGAFGIGVARVTAGGGFIEIQRADGANWTAGANGVEGRIVVEVR